METESRSIFPGIKFSYGHNHGVTKLPQEVAIVQVLAAKVELNNCATQSGHRLKDWLTYLDDSEECVNCPYRELLGSYTIICVRPDMCYAVSKYAVRGSLANAEEYRTLFAMLTSWPMVKRNSRRASRSKKLLQYS